MKKIKIWFLSATALILLGTTLFGFAACSSDWNFEKLFNQEYDVKTHEITQEFNHLSIDTDTADILFALSNDGKCKVECFEKKKVTHSVSVQDNKLTVKTVDERKWYDHIFDFSKDRITIYLPQIEYTNLTIDTNTGEIEILQDFKFENIDINGSTGNVHCCASASKEVKINMTTGDICVENITAQSMTLSVSTGDIFLKSVAIETTLSVKSTTGDARLTDLTCKTFSFDGSTGKVKLQNVIATQSFNIHNGTGDVEFEGCDAGDIFVNVSTGDITGTLLSEKSFITSTNTGKIDVPKNSTGGRCEIYTTTGNINIQIKN